VSQHDFIFSNQFCTGWPGTLHFSLAATCFFAFYYISLGVFPAWNTMSFQKIQQGLFSHWLKWRLVNSLIIFLPNLAFGYAYLFCIAQVLFQ
jgi:hypothetical protein